MVNKRVPASHCTGLLYSLTCCSGDMSGNSAVDANSETAACCMREARIELRDSAAGTVRSPTAASMGRNYARSQVS